jgi:hypothetical protein
LIDQPVSFVPLDAILLLNETSQRIAATFKLVQAVLRELAKCRLAGLLSSAESPGR